MQVKHLLVAAGLVVAVGIGTAQIVNGDSEDKEEVDSAPRTTTTVMAASETTEPPIAPVPSSSGVATTVASSAAPVAPVAKSAAPAPSVDVAPTTTTTITTAPTTTTTNPVTYTCRLTVSPGTPRSGQVVGVSVYIEPNAYTNRNVPVTITVAGRPDVTINGATNNQGAFLGKFTANGSDPGEVTAQMYRSGTPAGSCSSSYTVT